MRQNNFWYMSDDFIERSMSVGTCTYVPIGSTVISDDLSC